MQPETVLIIEDDPTLLRVLKDNFEFSGYVVKTASDGEQGLQEAVDGRPDLIILDIMLPGVNGYEICRVTRKQDLDMPIIMLTAKGQESDIVLGLNLGADDYMTKPFSIKELLARANAFLRRRREKVTGTHQFGECRLDTAARKLLRDGEEVSLTPKEFQLLEFFARNPGRAVTRDEILRSVWGSSVRVSARNVDRFVTTLRNKVESKPGRPTLIRTIRDIGYRFDPTPPDGF